MFGGIRNFFLQEAEAQAGRFVYWVPLFLALGIGSYYMLPSEPPLIAGLLGLAFAVSGGLVLKGEHKAGFALLILVCFAAGFVAAQWRTIRAHTPFVPDNMRSAEVIGTVAALEDFQPGQGGRVILEDLTIEHLSPQETPRKIRLRLRDDEQVYVGQRIKVLAQLHRPSGPVMPGGFDFQRYLYYRGIGAVGFAYYPPEILPDQSASQFWRMVESMRQSIAARIEAAVDFPEAGIAMALMIGRRTAIDEADQQAMRDAGLAHMLAISGLHVGLLSGVIFFLVRLMLVALPYCALHWPVKKIAAIIALCAAVFYMFLAGATVPTQRALIMVGLVFVAIVLDREAISLRLVALAAAVVLLVFPDSLVTASFHMSFAAVAALILAYEYMRPWLRSWYSKAGFTRRLALYFIGMALTTLIASTAIAPFALFHFQRLAVFDIPANLMAGPLMAFVIMPFAAISFLLMPLGLEFLPLWVMELGIGAVLDIAHWVSSWPMAVMTIGAMPLSALALFTSGLYIAAIWRGWLRLCGVIIALLSIWPAYIYTMPDVVVSDSMKLIAVKGEDGRVYVSQKRSEAFVRENWARSFGVPEGDLLLWPKEGNKGPLTCGEAGCRIVLHGGAKEHKIAILDNAEALAQECDWADVVFLKAPQGKVRCDNTQVVDLFDVFDNGSHALQTEGGQINVIDDRSLRGERPWVGD